MMDIMVTCTWNGQIFSRGACWRRRRDGEKKEGREDDDDLSIPLVQILSDGFQAELSSAGIDFFSNEMPGINVDVL